MFSQVTEGLFLEQLPLSMYGADCRDGVGRRVLRLYPGL